MANTTRTKKIWIDLDNSPHVPFFIPIIRALEDRGHNVLLTTRDCFQVCGLADHFGLNHHKVGTHHGANKLAKVAGTLWRSLQLSPLVLREKPDLSLSHGSRSLVILSSILRIPSVLLFDYEHAKIIPVFKPDLGIAPASITNAAIAKKFRLGLDYYQGIKEDVYVSLFKPDPLFPASISLTDSEILVTIRPPATEAHYHNPASDKLFASVVELLGEMHNVRMIILPRNERTQRRQIRENWPEWCSEGKISMPEQVLNGLDLIWHSDLVISGGGTMNREAAALGIPVYSIFRGKLGAVDKYLADLGRLTLIESLEDVQSKIKVVKRSNRIQPSRQSLALLQIVKSVEKML